MARIEYLYVKEDRDSATGRQPHELYRVLSDTISTTMRVSANYYDFSFSFGTREMYHFSAKRTDTNSCIQIRSQWECNIRFASVLHKSLRFGCADRSVPVKNGPHSFFQLHVKMCVLCLSVCIFCVCVCVIMFVCVCVCIFIYDGCWPLREECFQPDDIFFCQPIFCVNRIYLHIMTIHTHTTQIHMNGIWSRFIGNDSIEFESFGTHQWIRRK